MTITVNISLISHAFFTEDASISQADDNLCLLRPLPLTPSPSRLLIAFPELHSPDPPPPPPSGDPQSLSPPPTVRASTSSSSPLSGISTAAPNSPSPRRSHGKKRNHRRRNGRGKQNLNSSVQAWDVVDQSPPSKQKDHDNFSLETPSTNVEPFAEVVDCSDARCCVDDKVSTSDDSVAEAEVAMTEVREECSKSLGIVKEDLEFFGLRHVPRSAERVRLLTDAQGVVHIGVMVRNSDLNLRSIEELVIRKEKAEQEAENHRLQMVQKTQDYVEMQRKYDKLTEEVLRLRTMLSRANQLRRESEKAMELLRLEFEKLVKNFLLDDSPERKQHGEDDGEMSTTV